MDGELRKAHSRVTYSPPSLVCHAPDLSRLLDVLMMTTVMLTMMMTMMKIMMEAVLLLSAKTAYSVTVRLSVV